MDGWGCMHNRNGDRLEGAFVNDKLQARAMCIMLIIFLPVILYCYIM